MRGPLAHRRVGTDDKVSALAHAGIPPHHCAKLVAESINTSDLLPLTLNGRSSCGAMAASGRTTLVDDQTARVQT